MSFVFTGAPLIFQSWDARSPWKRTSSL